MKEKDQNNQIEKHADSITKLLNKILTATFYNIDYIISGFDIYGFVISKYTELLEYMGVLKAYRWIIEKLTEFATFISEYEEWIYLYGTGEMVLPRNPKYRKNLIDPSKFSRNLKLNKNSVNSLTRFKSSLFSNNKDGVIRGVNKVDGYVDGNGRVYYLFGDLHFATSNCGSWFRFRKAPHMAELMKQILMKETVEGKVSDVFVEIPFKNKTDKYETKHWEENYFGLKIPSSNINSIEYAFEGCFMPDKTTCNSLYKRTARFHYVDVRFQSKNHNLVRVILDQFLKEDNFKTSTYLEKDFDESEIKTYIYVSLLTIVAIVCGDNYPKISKLLKDVLTEEEMEVVKLVRKELRRCSEREKIEEFILDLALYNGLSPMMKRTVIVKHIESSLVKLKKQILKGDILKGVETITDTFRQATSFTIKDKDFMRQLTTEALILDCYALARMFHESLVQTSEDVYYFAGVDHIDVAGAFLMDKLNAKKAFYSENVGRGPVPLCVRIPDFTV